MSPEQWNLMRRAYVHLMATMPQNVRHKPQSQGLLSDLRNTLAAYGHEDQELQDNAEADSSSLKWDLGIQ